MRNSGIYALVNMANGRQYIGSSCRLAYRRKEHFGWLQKGRHKNRHLQAAFCKDGEAVFGFRVLIFCEKEELLRYEQALIDGLHPEYNLSPTAGSSRGVTASETTRARISTALSGRSLSEDAKLKISAAMMGRRRSPFSAEHRYRMSKSAIRGWEKRRGMVTDGK